MRRTVLIVDDQPEFRQRVRELLEADGFIVVGEAGDARDALTSARQLQPDVVLLDVRLPDGSGVDVARSMRGWDHAPLVVLTSTADYSRVVRDCGANGFIPKGNFSGSAFRAAVEAA